METTALLTQVRQAEKQLSEELEKLRTMVSERIEHKKLRTRKKLKDALIEDPQQRDVREHIEHMQLRFELLRNIRLNWRNFEKHAHERNIDLRINQFSALQHLITFLETGRGQENPDFCRDEDEEGSTARELMAYEVQPTGAGKTGAFAIETALLDVPTLILVPFDNLVDQTKEDLMKIGGIQEEDIGLVYAGVKEFGRKVTVATYASHASAMRKPGVYAKHVQNTVKFCICDEVHTALGDRTQESLESIDGLGNGKLSDEERVALDAEQEVLSHLDEHVSTKALKIGYTATPKLAKKHVQQYFPHFLGRVYHRDMVEAGILVPYKIVQCNGSVSENEIDAYISTELEAKILNRENIYEKLLGEYADALHTYEDIKKKNTYPLRGMAFCTSHAECEKFALQAHALGLRCEIVTGKEASGRQGREVISMAKEKLINGQIDLIVTVEKLCAGFNFPEVNAIIWARITSMAKTIQGIGRGGRSHKQGRLKKECCWVFETNWTIKNNAKRGRKPLRIADALALNGEEPESVCSMADGSLLNAERKISLKEDGKDGMVDINGRIAVGLNAYADIHLRPLSPITLIKLVDNAGLEPVPNVIAYGLGHKRIDLFWKEEVDALLPKRLNAQGVVDIDGRLAVGIAAYAKLSKPQTDNAVLLNRIEKHGIKPVSNVRVFSGYTTVDVYWKDEIDPLLTKEVDDSGVVNIGDREAIALKIYNDAVIKVDIGSLRDWIKDAGINEITNAYVCHKSCAVKVYWKDEVEACLPKRLVEGVADVEGRGAVGISAYTSHLQHQGVKIYPQQLKKWLDEEGMAPIPGVKGFARKMVDLYWKDLVDELLKRNGK